MTRVLAVIVLWDGMWQERFPVSVSLTTELEQSVREGTPLSVHCVMEMVLIIVHDGTVYSAFSSPPQSQKTPTCDQVQSQPS